MLIIDAGREYSDDELPAGDIHLKDQHPAEGLIESAKSQECDLTIMASHGRRGLKMVLLGSVAN